MEFSNEESYMGMEIFDFFLGRVGLVSVIFVLFLWRSKRFNLSRLGQEQSIKSNLSGI